MRRGRGPSTSTPAPSTKTPGVTVFRPASSSVERATPVCWLAAPIQVKRPALSPASMAGDNETPARPTSQVTRRTDRTKRLHRRANRVKRLLEDASVRGTPADWATAAVRAFARHQADLIVGEANNGGDMVG